MKKIFFYLSSILMVVLLFSSCVSKKKYEELARAKRSGDREIVNLQSDKKSLSAELLQLKEEFNAVRYQLTESNAVKDRKIDELYIKLRQLETKESELKSNLQDVAEQAKVAEQNTNSQLVALENRVKMISAERDSLKKQMTTLKTDLEWDNRKLSNEIDVVKSNIEFKDKEIVRLEKEIVSLKNQLANSMKSLSQRKQEVEKLTNQVKLLKKELAK